MLIFPNKTSKCSVFRPSGVMRTRLHLFSHTNGVLFITIFRGIIIIIINVTQKYKNSTTNTLPTIFLYTYIYVI